ncbi:MAG: hypothetical protein LBI77_01850 [Puniceicoccales bacterium]|jgi:hypothetical protein|nr:hypothetical protein [Puniceicoccales bacterium]
MVLKLLRDIFISLGFLLVFFGASFLFAGKTNGDLKRNEDFMRNQGKFFKNFDKILLEKDEQSLLNIFHSLGGRTNIASPYEKAVLRSCDTKLKVIKKTLSSELGFLPNVNLAIIEIVNSLSEDDRSEIFLRFPDFSERFIIHSRQSRRNRLKKIDHLPSLSLSRVQL